MNRSETIKQAFKKHAGKIFDQFVELFSGTDGVLDIKLYEMVIIAFVDNKTYTKHLPDNFHKLPVIVYDVRYYLGKTKSFLNRLEEDDEAHQIFNRGKELCEDLLV